MRWKQAWAQRPSSRPLVRRMMSRRAWWVTIMWSDWTRITMSPWVRLGSRLSTGNDGIFFSAGGFLSARPKRSSNSASPKPMVMLSRPSLRRS